MSEDLLRGEEIESSFLSSSRAMSLSVKSPSLSMSSSQIFLIWSWKLAISSGVASLWLSEDAVIGLPTVVEGLSCHDDWFKCVHVGVGDFRDGDDGSVGNLMEVEDLRGKVDGS